MVCACEREAGQYRAEFVVFPRQCLVDGVYQLRAQPFGQPLSGGVAQGHGFAGDGELVFQPGPGEAEQGLAHGYVAYVGCPGEDGDVAGVFRHSAFGWHQFQAAQQANERRAQAGVFVAQFGGFAGGVQPLVPVGQPSVVIGCPGGLQAHEQGQLAAGEAVF